MTIKELVKSFDGKSKEEIVQSLVDAKKEIELEEQAELIAKEDGIYYDWLNGRVSDNDYEEFIEIVIERLSREK